MILPPRIRDREHDAIAEPVIGHRNVVAMAHQPAGLDIGLGHAFSGKMLLQRVAAVRRKAQTERLLCGRRQPAIPEIGAGLCTFGALQPLLEEGGRHFHDIGQAGAFLFAPFFLGIANRHWHAGHIGDLLDRFGKAQPLEFGQELEMVARDRATETVVAALPVLAVEGWALFAMERTARPIVAARRVGLLAIPCDAQADHLGNRHTVAYFIEEGGWKAHEKLFSRPYNHACRGRRPLIPTIPGFHRAKTEGGHR